MKMNKNVMILTNSAAIMAVLSFTATSAVFAADSAQSSLVTQAKVTMQQVSDIVTNANTGSTISEINLKNENGVAVYKVQIINSDSTVSDIVVNAQDGTIIQKKDRHDKKVEKKVNKKPELKLQQQTLDNNWASMTDEQKEQVYALKDAELDEHISRIQANVAAGHKTQAEADEIISQIKAKKAAMRESGNAPKFKSIVNLPTVSSN